MGRVLTLNGPRDLVFEQIDHERALGEREVRLRAVLSGISQGTEMNLYRGTSPFDGSAFDPVLRSFVPDERQAGTYPIVLGYEMVAEVVEVGEGVDEVGAGALVHTGSPHHDHAIAELDKLHDFGYPLTVLPDGADPRPGIVISLGSVALQAIHDARIKVGDGVAVSGLGTIGLLVVQLAALNGADPIIAIDPIPERRRLAESLGAAVALDPSEALNVGALVKECNRNRGVDVAIETSGAAAGLHGAIAAVTVGGRVVSVGFYQGDAVGLRLGEEWHHNRPTMVSSMGVWGCPHRDHPAWDRQRLTDAVVKLFYDGRIQTAPLISDIAAFEDAADVYRAIDAGRSEVRTVGLAYPGAEHLIANRLDGAAARGPAEAAAGRAH